MITTPPAIQKLARQLLADEPVLVGRPDDDVEQAVRACERLRVPLIRLAGAGGFSSLLSRALALAAREAPELAALRISPDGSLEGSNKIPPDAISTEAVRQAGVILVAELLGLLVTLVGQPLTLGIVRDAWPGVSIEIATRGSEDKS